MRLMPNHISFARLADLAEGRLAATEREQATTHLSDCARCAGQLARLERTLTVMRTDEATDAPRAALIGAIGMFRARFTKEFAQEEAPSKWKRVVAALSFDSTQLAPAFGVRAGQTAEARQLLFSAGETDVDLRLAATSAGWTISGQVLGDCAGGRVRVESVGGNGAPPVAAELNELCEFTLPPLPSGSYKLWLRVGDTEVEVPDLQLK